MMQHAGDRLFHLDALRAAAIILVLLYHFNMPFFSKGYLGVDLFFMLSGFLMAHTMMRDHSRHGRFRIVSFYKRRFKRIVPSLVILVLVVVALSILVLSSIHLKRVAKESFYALSFVSNIYFYFKSDYFSPVMNSRPFLHTWSLSLEEQFYIFFGFMLLLGNFLHFGRVVAFFGGVSLVVFLVMFSIYFLDITDRWALQKKYFYLLPFRLYMFMGGVILGYLHWTRMNGKNCSSYSCGVSGNFFAALGISGFILISVLDQPVISAGFIAWAFWLPMLFFGGGILNVLGRNGIVKFVAMTSYQVYLVHWPILFFYRYIFFEEPNLWQSSLLILLSFVLGWALWKVSNRMMEAGRLSVRSLARVGVAALTTILLSAYIVAEDGLKWRIPDERSFRSGKEYINMQHGVCTTFSKKGFVHCTVADEKRNAGRILIVGDSHADHLAPGLAEVLGAYDLTFVVQPACPPFAGYIHGKDVFGLGIAAECFRHNRKLFEYLSVEKFDAVLVSYRFYNKYSGVQGLIDEAVAFDRFLRDKGHKAIWILPIPFPGIDVPYCLSAPRWFPETLVKNRCRFNEETLRSLRAYNQKIRSVIGGDRIVDAGRAICADDARNCRLHDDVAGVFYRDSNHLTPNASIQVMKSVKWRLHELLRK